MVALALIGGVVVAACLALGVVWLMDNTKLKKSRPSRSNQKKD